MQEPQPLKQTLLTGQEHQPNTGNQIPKPSQRLTGGSTCLQYLFFTWVHPLLTYAARTEISVADMPKMPQRYATAHQFNRLYQVWNSTPRSSREGMTLFKALYRGFKREWIILLVVLVIVEVLFVGGPILTALSIDYIQNHRDEKGYGIFLFVVTFLTTFLYRMSYSHVIYWLSILGVNLENSLTMMIYAKSLKFAEQANKSFTEAEIINYSQVDAEKMTNIGYHLSAFFYGPFQFVIGLIMLYWTLGITFLTAVGIMTVVLIISYFLSKISARYNEDILKAKDERMKVTQQMLDIIRFIKISTIEKFFFRKVSSKRAKQIGLYFKMGLYTLGSICLFWVTSPLLQSVSFLVFVLAGGEMTSQVAFTSMMIFYLFEYPLWSLPTAITEVIQIWTSFKRIQKFLLAQEISKEHIQYQGAQSQFAIQIQNGNFYWRREQDNKQGKENKQEADKANSKDSFRKSIHEVQNSLNSEITIENSDSESEQLSKFKEKDDKGRPLYIHAIKDVDIKFRRGALTMIVGDIGSGKSSLLLAVLNQMLTSEEAKVIISGSIAYSSQKPWIMSKTLKENVTFLAPFDEKRLKTVINYACLSEDLKMLPRGLETEIGQKGINLSGGQKARVSLARALYSDKDILLLDDILSAVDVHVGEFIVRETFGDFLRGKTVIMPTHAVKFTPYADEIVVMKKGRIVRKGHYKDICNTPQFQQVYVKDHAEEENGESNKQKEQEQKLQAEMAMIKEALKMKASSEKMKAQQTQLANEGLIQELILPEDHQTGQLNMQILKSYIQVNKGLVTLLVLGFLMMLIWMAVKTSASMVLQLWCQNPSQDQTYLYLFMGLCISSVVFIFIRGYFFLLAGNNQSKLVHDKVIKGLLYADLNNFFNRVPIGRIVNRLTKDLRELDEAVMEYLIYVIISICELLGGLFVCIYAGTPFALVPMFVVGFLANKLRKYFLNAEREVSRLQKSTNSPVVSGFLSAISGLAIIRAYKMEEQFTQMQISSFDTNKRVRLTKAGLQNWFAMVLSFLSFLINMPCIAYCMFAENTDPATMGLLMVYALGVSDSVVNITQSEAGFQSKLVSIERIYKFMNIEPERKYTEYCKDWSADEEKIERAINRGEVEFKNLRVRYRKGLPDVIKGVTCTIRPGEKVGIVGRTGAGKTTIINTLLGITDISSGEIFIDGTPIQDFSIKALRQSITMIDQDPTLIKASFRQNLDMTNSYSDEELQKILKECNLFQIIQEKGGLASSVSNTSLSAGEKQLLCICRAFLKHSKVVLIDEATANIDVKNDAIIQRVIAEKFKESTVLTIAHRLSTLQSSDKIMVMSEGQLVEFGRPGDLQAKGGIYATMISKHLEEMLK